MAGQYIEAMLRSILHRLRLPGQCEVCRRWCAGGLCARCEARFAAAAPRCPRCALRVGTAGLLCAGCLREPPPFEHTVCVADYAFPWDSLVGGLKFRGRLEWAALLAHSLEQAVRASATPAPDLVLPLPLAAPRLAERGFNQAWEIARPLAHGLGRRADARLLQRPLPGVPQAGMTRAARLSLQRGAFMVEPSRRDALIGRRVALVDDVLTTGATARAASAELLRAGAAAVDVWVVARTA